MRSPGTVPEVLATRSTEIADSVTDAMARHVSSSSAWMMAEHDRRRLMRAQMIKRVLDLIASGEPFSADDLRSAENLGRSFAEHHAPLSLLVASFDVGITEIARESWRIAPAERFAEMAQFTERVARMLEQARPAAIRGYLQARAADPGQSVRRALAEALIGGEPATAQAIGERLAPAYLVLACAVPDPARVDAGQMAAIQRDIESTPGALHCGDLSALTILLPAEDTGPLPDSTAAELAGRVRSQTGQLAHAAQARRPGLAGIPAAHQEACQALTLVKAIPDADSRPYRMDELLVELAIARQPDVRQRLTALLAPLNAGTDLHRTLEVLLACNLDRERTAKELRIHRRTLWYRMDRIRDLSGIDPDSAQGIQLLRAALTAPRLPAWESREPKNPGSPLPEPRA